MKRLFFILVAGALTIQAVNAQFGFRAGLNISNVHASFEGLNMDTKPILGFHAGITGDAQIAGPVYLNVSALYSTKGFIYQSANYHISYVEIPVNFHLNTISGSTKL